METPVQAVALGGELNGSKHNSSKLSKVQEM